MNCNEIDCSAYKIGHYCMKYHRQCHTFIDSINMQIDMEKHPIITTDDYEFIDTENDKWIHQKDTTERRLAHSMGIKKELLEERTCVNCAYSKGPCTDQNIICKTRKLEKHKFKHEIESTIAEERTCLTCGRLENCYTELGVGKLLKGWKSAPCTKWEAE